MDKNQIKHTTWNLEMLFTKDTDPKIDEDLAQAQEKTKEFITKWKNRKDYLQNPETLAQALSEYEEWMENYGTEGNSGYYFWLRTQQDQDNPNLKARLNSINDVATKLGNEIQFFMYNVSKIPQEKQEEFLKYPPLSKYRHFLKKTFEEAKYLLGEEEEKLLNLVSQTSHSNWVKMLSTFLSKEEEKTLDEDGKLRSKTHAELAALATSKNKKVRDMAAKKINKIIKKHVEVAEAELNSILAFKKTQDELRKINRPDLLRHINDDIDSKVVDALVNAVASRYDISQRYYELKAKLLGVTKLEYHERNVEYGELNTQYSFEEAYKLVHKTFTNLDAEFAKILDEFNENGHFDVFPKKGKGGGAFCVAVGIKQPTYVFLNHTNRLNDVLTLAHEMGHAINDELMKKAQNTLNFGTPLSTAEVASTFMEDFVLQELSNKVNDETKLAIMMMKLNDDVSSIFRQVACYKFEQDLHTEFRKKMYLSKEEIGNLFKKHMQSYMGDFVEQSPGSEHWWVHWGHIRRFFYVYSYASGLLISKSLQNSVHKDAGFITKVKQFLSLGLSKAPHEIFLDLGIDIKNQNFWNKGLDEVEKLLAETTELATKLKKIQK